MSRLLLFLSLLSVSLVNSSHPGIITLRLIPTLSYSPPDDPFSTLAILTSHSLAQARHHRNRRNSSSIGPPVAIPSSPRSYGGYSTSLSFGTPPQTVTFIVDTGSSLVWFPCTTHYLCVNCDRTSSAVFIPKKSSSVKILGCRNPKCQWLYGDDALTDCPSPSEGSRSCRPYAMEYGAGSTAGVLLLDTLSVSSVANFSDFLVGCSVNSIKQPEGIAGFGRSRTSIPSQLQLKRFSYCLVSHHYDDDPSASSILILDRTGGGSTVPGLSFTPFRKNPTTSDSILKEFYYLTLRRITIGTRSIKIPHKFSFPGADGNGGTIIDSGSTFTYMEKPLFEMIATEFKRQMGKSSIASDVENRTGLAPCFRVPNWPEDVPEMAFHFKNRARMELLLSNYFPLVGGSDTACLLIITDANQRSGPSVILANYQQMNFYFEYDLENQKLGFKRHNCMDMD